MPHHGRTIAPSLDIYSDSKLADALLILAGTHACAAIVHHHVWRDRTLTRMLPGAS